MGKYEDCVKKLHTKIWGEVEITCNCGRKFITPEPNPKWNLKDDHSFYLCNDCLHERNVKFRKTHFQLELE